jgi:hypothetical protein
MKLPTSQELIAAAKQAVAKMKLPGRALCTIETMAKRILEIEVTRRKGIVLPQHRNPNIPAGITAITGFEKLFSAAGHLREKFTLDNEYVQALDVQYATLDPKKAQLAVDHIYKELIKLITAFEATNERLRYEMLTTGAIAIDTEKAKLAVDFQIADDHLKTLGTTKRWFLADMATFTGSVTADLQLGKSAVQRDGNAAAKGVLMNSNTYGSMWDALCKEFKDAGNELPKGWLDQHNNDGHIKAVKGMALEIEDRTSGITDKKGNAIQLLADGKAVIHTGKGVLVEYEGLVNDLEAGTATGLYAKTATVVDPSAVECYVQDNRLPALPNPDRVYVLTAY